MSYEKAADLLRLARMAAAARQGVTYAQVAGEFGIHERSAKRMVAVLERVFEVERLEDEERRARFRIREGRPLDLPERPETTLEALKMALHGMDPGSDHAQALRDLRHRLLASLDRNKARRAEAEAETFLQAYGYVATPGPRTRKAPEVMQAISRALRGPFLMVMRYRDDTVPRIVEPYGLLMGNRDYLIARQPAKGASFLKFRLDQIREAASLNESFVLDEGFSIEDHAAEGFGVWNDPGEMAEVVWRFLPEAAERAAEFVFHPRQVAQRHEDGSLIVRFVASGWTEMTWYLYHWGNQVEVLAPPQLRAMVEGYQRPDFDALP